MTASRSAVLQDVRLSTENARFPSTSYGEGNPRFFLPVCVEKNWCNWFSRTGVSRSKEGDQQRYRASLWRYLRGEIFVKTGVYRCHNLRKDVLFLGDERGFLTVLAFA